MGCYNDTHNRALPNYRGAVSTQQQCQQLASQNNDTLYGIQYYGQCYSGSNLQQATQYGKYNGNCGNMGVAWVNQLYYAQPNTMCNYQMSPNELQCYKNNYPDLSALNPQQLQQHWTNTGCLQFRNNQCPNYQTSSADYIYKGCFNDTVNRALPNYRGNVQTIDQCRQYANQYQDTIFGIQNGNECFTGSNLQQATQYGQIFNKESCPQMGGPWINQIYVRGQPFPPPPPPIPQLSQNNFSSYSSNSNDS